MKIFFKGGKQMNTNGDEESNLSKKKEKCKKKILGNNLKIIGSVVFLILLNYSSKYVLFPLSHESNELLKFGESFLFERDLASIAITLPVSYLTVIYDVSKYLENKKMRKIISSIDSDNVSEDKVIIKNDEEIKDNDLNKTLGNQSVYSYNPNSNENNISSDYDKVKKLIKKRN